MRNKVLVKNPKRTFLTAAVAIAALFVAGFLTIFFMLKISRDQNYNGSFTTISGTVKAASVASGSDVWFLYLEDDDNRYCTTPVEGMLNWDKLEGKSVEIYIPAKQVVVSPPLVLGLKVDGTLVIDPDKTVKRMRADNTDLIVMMILIMVFATAGCGIFVLRLYVPKCNETSFAHAYAKWLASVTPNFTGNRFAIAIAALCAGIFLLSAAAIDEAPESMKTALVIIPIAAIVVGAVGVFFVARWAKQKTNEFFANHFPFDFGDFSYLHLPKKVREKSEKRNREFDEKHPHTFGDRGNGVWVKFGETGVDLFYALEEQDRQSTGDSHDNNNETQVFEEASADKKKYDPFLHITYDRLNFEAVAFLHLTSTNAIVVVVKSRLNDDDEAVGKFSHFADEADEGKLLRDLHFAFDINLLNTFRKFDVPVENLDYILQNHAELIFCQKRSTFPENFD